MCKVLNARKVQALERDAALHRPPEQMGQPVRHRTRRLTRRRHREISRLDRCAARAHRCDELRGRDLVCWCAPLSCHGDVLVELANGR